MQGSGDDHTAWRDEAVICGVGVSRFRDGNEDTVGDVREPVEKVPCLAELGVACIWLLPFHPSISRNDGCDVLDYCQVDPRHRTLQELIESVRAAGENGIRVVVDLVMQHTSDRQPPKSCGRAALCWARSTPFGKRFRRTSLARSST